MAALLLVVGLGVGIALPSFRSGPARGLNNPQVAVTVPGLLPEKAARPPVGQMASPIPSEAPAASAPLIAENKDEPLQPRPEMAAPDQPPPSAAPGASDAAQPALSGALAGAPVSTLVVRRPLLAQQSPPVSAKSSPTALARNTAVGADRLVAQSPSASGADEARLETGIRDTPSSSTVIDSRITGFPVALASGSASTADYAHAAESPFLAAKENPLSTFSADVDTASYAIVRRFIDAGQLPPPDAVRVEEMLNYFPSSDAPPAPGSDQPFAIHLEAAACPWNTAHRLVRIGLQAREIDAGKRPASNLVFLLDVSGSMRPAERLPLIKQCLRPLVERLREDDHVAIVTYAGESGLALPPTSGDHKDAILRAIDKLRAGGSTNGAAGIRLAYQVARQGFIPGGTNRVILATDGDFNVGTTSRGALLRLVETERRDGVFLSVLGVGTDNLKDSTMQTLADHGNGNYNYLDRLEEGRKVLVNQMSGTLVAVAKDVKIQVEFNPAVVASYRLIGYEKRLLRKEDFNDDKIDAGEIGAGHSVTALYEVVPVGQPGGNGTVDPLKYQPPAPDARPAAIPGTHQTAAPEMLTVKLRHKAPDGDTSERSHEEPLIDRGAPGDYADASADFRFAAAVASFGLVLRDSPHKGDATLDSALELAQGARGEDPNGYRAGFVELVRHARALEQERGR